MKRTHLTIEHKRDILIIFPHYYYSRIKSVQLWSFRLLGEDRFHFRLRRRPVYVRTLAWDDSVMAGVNLHDQRSQIDMAGTI